MNDTPLLSAEQFAETRHELPENGRWIELVAGRAVTLDPPEVAHGNVVLNLSKALAAYFQQQGDAAGSFCFELGLLVSRDPDTVRFPAMCYFTRGERFAETGNTLTDTPPDLVVEIAETDARCREMSARIEAYHRWGVETVWVADATENGVHVASRQAQTSSLSDHEILTGHPALAGFEIRVGDLFADPEWWR